MPQNQTLCNWKNLALLASPKIPPLWQHMPSRVGGDVEISGVDGTKWPFSERVYIVTNAPKANVAAWLEPLPAASIEEGFASGVPASWPTLRPSMNVFAARWE